MIMTQQKNVNTNPRNKNHLSWQLPRGKDAWSRQGCTDSFSRKAFPNVGGVALQGKRNFCSEGKTKPK